MDHPLHPNFNLPIRNHSLDLGRNVAIAMCALSVTHPREVSIDDLVARCERIRKAIGISDFQSNMPVAVRTQIKGPFIEVRKDKKQRWYKLTELGAQLVGYAANNRVLYLSNLLQRLRHPTQAPSPQQEIGSAPQKRRRDHPVRRPRIISVLDFPPYEYIEK